MVKDFIQKVFDYFSFYYRGSTKMEIIKKISSYRISQKCRKSKTLKTEFDR